MLPTRSTLSTRSTKQSSLRWSGVVLVLLVTLAALGVHTPLAHAQDADTDDGLVGLDSVASGTLLFATDRPGLYVPAPALDTNIEIAVSGPLARTVVTQRFRNVAEVFVEGKYLFPLPEGAAVDTLRMQVGDRWIRGVIEGKEEARAIYEEAQSAGHVASLVEQIRPNVFATAVANIAPNAAIVVQIEYQQSLAPSGGAFGLRVPLVVGPRYVPDAQLLDVVTLGADGWQVETKPQDTAAHGGVRTNTSDDSAIPAVRNPVSIAIDLNAGFPVDGIDSLYHDIDVVREGETAASIELTGAVPSNRDFFLSWSSEQLDDPYGAVFAEKLGDETHVVALLSPPSLQAVAGARSSREVIFVQDTSGSMSGPSIEQAKAGLELAVLRLHPDDLFNVIEFNTHFSAFSPKPVPASAANVRQAVKFVRNLKAENGTEMQPPLEFALRDDSPTDERLRQVIFLTDGLVTNEQEMLQLIEEDLGRSRLFTVGIGSAPNSYFMTAAARAGRGATVFIGDVNEVDAQMSSLFTKIETPAIVDITLQGLPDGVQVSPSPVPDLYVGDPIVLTARVPAGTSLDTIELAGKRGSRGWELALSLGGAEERAGVSKLWAREHIRDLEASRTLAALSEDEHAAIDTAIRDAALEFGLVSRMTSLVAVDVEVARSADNETTSTEVPLALPDEWDASVFAATDASAVDGKPADSLSRPLQARLEAADQARPPVAYGPRTSLAVTGTQSQLLAMIGAALLSVGCGALGASRRAATGRTQRRTLKGCE